MTTSVLACAHIKNQKAARVPHSLHWKIWEQELSRHFVRLLIIKKNRATRQACCLPELVLFQRNGNIRRSSSSVRKTQGPQHRERPRRELGHLDQGHASVCQPRRRGRLDGRLLQSDIGEPVPDPLHRR